MKISVLMAACNQGEYLKETVDSAVRGLAGARDWEIIIIDDHSDDGCCDLVEQTDRIRVHRPDERMGVSAARHLAGKMATGDVLITTDTHFNYPRKSLWRMSYHWAMRNRAVIIPTINMEHDTGRSHIEYGRMAISKRGLRIDRPHRKPEIVSMFGGCYLMRRDVWNWLGGWIQLPGYWAGEEQIMTVLAYRFRIPLMTVDKHICTHRRYRKHGQYPYELPPHHPAEIAHYIHATCFPKTYEHYWGPMIEQFYGGYEMQSDPFPLREWIDRRAIYSEEWFIENVLKIKDLAEHPVIKQMEPVTC